MSEDKKLQLSDIENPALIYAMYEMKEKKTKETEAKFISELRTAKFITPAIIEVKGENGEYQIAKGGTSKAEDTRISFMMLTTDKGEKYLPAFTSMDEVKKWRKEEKLQTVVSNFEQYLAVITSDDNGPAGLVIDPFGSNIIMSRDLFKNLKEAADKQKNEKIFIGEPNRKPEELENAFTEFFDENGSVEKAYLQMMKRGEAVSFLLVVDYDITETDNAEKKQAERRTLFDAIAKASKEHLKGMPLSIASYDDDFGKKAVENKIPFYTR